MRSLPEINKTISTSLDQSLSVSNFTHKFPVVQLKFCCGWAIGAAPGMKKPPCGIVGTPDGAIILSAAFIGAPLGLNTST